MAAERIGFVVMEAMSEGASLAARFREARARSLRLAASLSPEDQQVQAYAEASPTKWHLGHTTWFFETFVLARQFPRRKRFRPEFELLFNSYYEAVGPRVAREGRGILSRPSLDEVHAYRAAIDTEMETLLSDRAAMSEPVRALTELGIHHEAQHQELLLTDILANFSANPLKPAWRPLEAAMPASKSIDTEWIEIEGGLVDIGHAGEGFHFDNEAPAHRVFLAPCALRNTLVTNAEVIAFIDAGGYREPRLWLSDGIAWVRQNDIAAPAYWRKDDDGRWHSFTLYGERAIDPHAPATHLSGYEADAIATWLGARLPTEHEWEHAARTLGGDPSTGRWLENGPVMPAARRDGSAPFYSLWGEAWEWTRSAYAPYPGFRPRPGAVGEYNGKFMCNQWVLRGGSCATPPGHLRASYRNFFYPHQRWQLTGLRLAKDAA